jgi:SAM-dependent methyltransferase
MTAGWPVREQEHLDRRAAHAEWVCYDFARRWASGRRVLDVDCAAGYGSWLLSRGGAALVIGVSENREALAWARTWFAVPEVQFREGGGRSLPLASGDVELAVSFETLERLRDVPAFVEELHRVIAPGGHLLVSTRLTRGPSRLHPQDPLHAREYDDRELPALLAPRFFIAERFGLIRPAGRLRARPSGLLPWLALQASLLLPTGAQGLCLRLSGAGLAPQARIVGNDWEKAQIQLALARRVA